MHITVTSFFRALLLVSVTPIALAIPSVTDHRDHARLHDVVQNFQTPNQPAAYRSSWSKTSTNIIDWFREFFNLDLPPQSVLAEPPTTGLSTSLLAQYGDQLVLRFNVSTDEEMGMLHDATEILFLDIWASGSDWVDVRLAKDVVPSLLTLLPVSLQAAHKPLMQGRELVQAIFDTYPSPRSASGRDGFDIRRAFSSSFHNSDLNSENVFFNEYQPLEVIYHWIRLLQSIFSGHTQLISVGRTSEGRHIEALRVSGRQGGLRAQSGTRKTLVVIGGQHAREWISVAAVNYVAYSFITKYGRSSSTTKLLQDIDLIFVPTLNPDGYKYSFEADRLWRKTRSPTALPFCPGLDLDRCWSFEWDGETTKDNPCSEDYAGEAPLEAIEARTFVEWARTEMTENNVEFVGLLDLHSYSEEILYPYSYSCGESPPTLEDLMEVGEGLSKAIRGTSKQNYIVKSACEGSVEGVGKFYPQFGGGGGSLLDWFYHELGVRKTYQIKLRDKGVYGFLLPKEYIIPTGSEVLSAVQYLAQDLVSSTSADLSMGSEDRNHMPMDSGFDL